MRVHFQVIEGTRKRTQVFEGIVIGRQGSGSRETFIVRKQSFGVGVERIFPVHSPKIEKLEVVARGDVRRAKLYYLRGRVGKRARVAERRWGIEDDLVLATEDEAVPLDSEGEAQEEVEDVPPEADAEGEGEGEDAAAEETPAAEAAEAPAEAGAEPEAEADAPEPEAAADEAAAEPEGSAESEPDEAADSKEQS